MPIKKLVAGLDGTGSLEWRRRDGANSHVFRFLTDVTGCGSGDLQAGVRSDDGGKRYWHGPGTAGLEMGSLIHDTYIWLVEEMERLIRDSGCAQSDIKICIVGHSRGATAAIAVCNYLREDTGRRILASTLVRTPVAVEYLGLYDTVNMSLAGWGLDTRLPNVHNGRHARRMRIDNDPARGSRGYFGTVVTEPRVATAQFDTAHGGMGGDPGYFKRLGDSNFETDYYCNALTWVLTQQELDREYGTIFRIPRQSALTGQSANARKAFLRRVTLASPAVDTHIRQGAALAGFGFATPASRHVPYAENQAHLWNRLRPMLAT